MYEQVARKLSQKASRSKVKTEMLTNKQKVRSQMIDAVLSGHASKVAELLKLGVPIELRDLEHDESLLSLAFKLGYLDVADLLLENGADIESRNDCGRSILSLTPCCDRNGNISHGFKLLLKIGADINSVDDDGTSVLQYQLERGLSYEATLFLLNAGASPSTVDIYGESALSVA